MITLKSLKLNNFLSHEKTVINFATSEKTLISGDSGSGKSAIFESIIFALYGKGRTENRSLIRKGTQKATVNLVLRDGINEYEIERSITSTGKNTISVWINGMAHTVSGVKETQKWIETELVGMSYLLFINSIAYGQGNINSFVDMPASGRKDLLLDIIKAGDFAENYEKSKKAIAHYVQEQVITGGMIINLKDQIEKSITIIKEKDSLKTQSDQKRNEIIEQEDKQKEINKKIQEISSRTIELDLQKRIIDGIRKELDTTEAGIKRVNAAKTLLGELDKQTIRREEMEERLTKKRLTISELETSVKNRNDANQLKNSFYSQKPTIASNLDKIDSLERRKKQIEETEDCPSGDKCPYMLKKLGQIALFQKDIEDEKKKTEEEAVLYEKWREEYDKLESYDNEELQADTRKLNQLKEEEKNLAIIISNIYFEFQKKPELEKEIETLTRLESEKTEVLTRLQDAYDKKEALELLINKEEGQRLQKESLEIINKIEITKKEEVILLARLNHINLLEEELRKSLTTLKEKEEYQKEIERKVELFTMIKEVFGSKGLKTVILDFILPSLENEINNFLSQMSDFKVRLDTQKLKTDGEGTTEGLFITIINEIGEELSYENYSGGEKVRITIAITEAIASLGKQVGFRLVDEAITSLDQNMTESFALVFRQLQNNYPQVFITSHLPEIQNLLGDTIELKKKNGISYIAK